MTISNRHLHLQALQPPSKHQLNQGFIPEIINSLIERKGSGSQDGIVSLEPRELRVRRQSLPMVPSRKSRPICCPALANCCSLLYLGLWHSAGAAALLPRWQDVHVPLPPQSAREGDMDGYGAHLARSVSDHHLHVRCPTRASGQGPLWIVSHPLFLPGRHFTSDEPLHGSHELAYWSCWSGIQYD